jgi:5-methylcytosine-specific restriction endonuclease McrA
VDELVTAATGRSKAQLLDWLASRFPRPAAPTVIRPVTPLQRSAAGPDTTDILMTQPAGSGDDSHAPARVNVPTAAPVAATPTAPTRDRARLAPLNAEQVKVQFTMSRQVLDKMRRAMDLLGPKVRRDDVAALFEHLLDMALPVLEKKRCAATDRPRAPRARQGSNARFIPAHVKREVWRRDGGRCTFQSATGRRCACRRGLELDHVKPVSLGGGASTENLRLLCRTHNRLEAERRLGKEFMRQRRGSRRTAPVRPSTALSG